jgi:hypothetical protein
MLAPELVLCRQIHLKKISIYQKGVMVKGAAAGRKQHNKELRSMSIQHRLSIWH